MSGERGGDLGDCDCAGDPGALPMGDCGPLCIDILSPSPSDWDAPNNYNLYSERSIMLSVALNQIPLVIKHKTHMGFCYHLNI